MTQRHSNDTWNFIRGRLGLCPIEKVVRGKSQNAGIVFEDREEMTLNRFKQKHAGASKTQS